MAFLLHSPSSHAQPQFPVTRWLAISLVLLAHVLAIWQLMAHRLLPVPDAAVTLMVNFIAPPAVQPVAPKPAPRPVEMKPIVKPKTQQLLANAPVSSPVEYVAPPAPQVIAAVASVPAMPLPAGTVALGGELSLICPDRRAPAYPAISRRLGERGNVVLRVTLDAHGNVAKASVDRSSGFTRLDEAALGAVRQWRCTPAQRNGHPVEATALQPFNFVIEG